MVMHHTIQEKEKSDLGEFGCARGPQCLSSDFFVFHGHAPCLVTDRAYDDHATHLATRPWGERASQIRVRARADFFLFFILFRMVCSIKGYHAEKNKKWLPASRVRARTPTHTSPPAPLEVLPTGTGEFFADWHGRVIGYEATLAVVETLSPLLLRYSRNATELTGSKSKYEPLCEMPDSPWSEFRNHVHCVPTALELEGPGPRRH